MISKQKISKQRWTPFWNYLNIVVPKRQRFLRSYQPRRSDFAALRRLGVSAQEIERAYNHFSGYADELAFHKFSKFFRKHSQTIEELFRVSTPADAFAPFLNRFIRNSIAALREKLGEIYLISELNRKGEGRRYEIAYRGIGSTANLEGVKFTRILNRSDVNSRYKHICTFEYKGHTVVCIQRRGDGGRVYKFIKARRDGSRIRVRVSADSKAEFALIRAALRDHYNSYVDTPQDSRDLDQIRQFLVKGDSAHFTLTGVTYDHDDYRVQVAPTFGRTANVASYRAYSKHLRDNHPESVVSRFLLAHKDLPIRSPVSVDIRSPRTTNIVDALMFNANDYRLGSKDREQIESDFYSDFGVDLNTFVTYESNDDKNLYRKLLQSTGRRSGDMELRSESSLKIYRYLVDGGIIDADWETQHQPLICIDRACAYAYRTQIGVRRCGRCGCQLLPGRTVVSPKLDEKGAAQYIEKNLRGLGFTVESFKKKLLNRDIYVVSIPIRSSSVEIVPIASAVKESQVELLKLRFPNALVLTSKDNLDVFLDHGICVDRLYESIYALAQRDSQSIRTRLEGIERESLSRIRRYATSAASAYRDASFYTAKNREIRNLGAEFFEAHTFLLLADIFKNSIWLGAKERGKPLPDGISAFPLLSRALGCLLWDSKFSEGNVNLGKHDKNKHYIDSARNNSSIRKNGGLGAFVFVGNRPGPNTFSKRYRKLGGVRKPKIIYLEASVLLLLHEHFRSHEADFQDNNDCWDRFVDLLREIFFSTANGNKAVVLAAPDVEPMLREKSRRYAEIRRPRVAG